MKIVIDKALAKMRSGLHGVLPRDRIGEAMLPPDAFICQSFHRSHRAGAARVNEDDGRLQSAGAAVVARTGPDFLIEIQSPGDDTDEKLPF